LEGIAERGETVKWKWGGISENGMLTFTLPDLYPDRKFTLKLPPDIAYERPGTYEFKIKNVKKNGAVIEFADQKKKIHDQYLRQVEENGLGIDQLRTFINNGIINRYATVLHSEPVERLVEQFSGKVSVKNDATGEVQDLSELGGVSDAPEVPAARGLDKIKEKMERGQEKIDEQTQALADRYSKAPELQRMFLTMTPEEGSRVVDVVAGQFPEESSKGKISLPSILATRPVVEFIMRTIVDPTVPIEGAGGKADPWIALTIDHIRRDAVRNPVLFKQFVELMRQTQDKKVKKAPAGVEPETRSVMAPVPVGAPSTTPPVTSPAETVKMAAEGTPAPTVAEVQAFINSISESIWRVRLNEFKPKLQEAIQKASSDPALRKFFDRRHYFTSWLEKGIQRFKDQLIYISELDPADEKDMEYRTRVGRQLGIIKPETLPAIDPETPEGQAIIERQVKAFITRSIKKLQQPGLDRTASVLEPESMQRLMAHAYHLVMSGARQ
jgi:hypothetical protein